MDPNENRRPTVGAAAESPAKKSDPIIDPATDRRHPDTMSALAAMLRDQGIAEANSGMDPWWRSCADLAIRPLAEGGYPFTASDMLDLIPPAERPNQVGARLHAACRAGLIRPIGFAKSRRPSRHSGVVRVWAGVTA